MSLDLTRDWLQSVLRSYPARDRILPEVLGVLGSNRTLAVKTDAFSASSLVSTDHSFRLWPHGAALTAAWHAPDKLQERDVPYSSAYLARARLPAHAAHGVCCADPDDGGAQEPGD